MADMLLALATEFPKMPVASTEWLDKFVGVSDIDPGEAQIYALAAEKELRVLTGDKRALKAVGSLSEVSAKLDGNVVTIEAVLLGLSNSNHGSDAELRERGSVLGTYDHMARAVFASASSSLDDALDSYFRSVEREAQPMRLWRPA